MKFVAVTSCPTGIAHTYMAAEGLEQAAKAAGHEIEVETQGAAGLTPLSPDTIAAADAVIFAADVEVRDAGRFAGKPLVRAGVKKAISDGPGLIAQAVAAAEESRVSPEAFAASGAAAPAGRSGGGLATKVDSSAPVGTRIRQWLMTGVSYMIPFVAAGGIMIALGFMVAQLAGGKNGAIIVTKLYSLTGPPSPNPTHLVNIVTDFNPTDGMHWAALLFLVGAAAFAFLVPILSGFIAFAIADRPGLAPGIVGGAIASTMGAGFLGGIATGFIGGFAALWISRWRVPKGVRGVMPVVVIPLLSTIITGATLVLVLGRPLKALSDGLASWLGGLTGTNLIFLGVILGLMMGFDLGGPVNKVAYTFATAGLAARRVLHLRGRHPVRSRRPLAGHRLQHVRIGRRRWPGDGLWEHLAGPARWHLGSTADRQPAPLRARDSDRNGGYHRCGRGPEDRRPRSGQDRARRGGRRGLTCAHAHPSSDNNPSYQHLHRPQGGPHVTANGHHRLIGGPARPTCRPVRPGGDRDGASRRDQPRE